MNNNEKIINIGDLNMTVVTDEQVHDIYNKLSEVDKTSTDNLTAASEETDSSTYTSEDNTKIEAIDDIPGVNAIPSNIVDSIQEDENDIKDVLNEYDLDEKSIVQILKVIEEYKAGNTSCLYSRLPAKIKMMVDGMIDTVNPKQITCMRNAAAKMLIDSFISDAKMSATADEFNSELASAINEMNIEYDEMINNAIDNTFNKIEEIRISDPEQAERLESVKKAFNTATTFEKQLEFAKKTSVNKFNKFLNRYEDDVMYFNNKVNNNFAGVKIPNIEELVPIIKAALPQYTEDEIKKFIICICRTIEDTNELSGIAYEYRMISSIYKYKYTNIDEKGEVIFGNISKVIEAI